MFYKVYNQAPLSQTPSVLLRPLLSGSADLPCGLPVTSNLPLRQMGFAATTTLESIRGFCIHQEAS